MKQYKLLILGASNTQLPIIHKAIELGYYVITVDNLPNNIGHQFSHESVNCSTVDQDGVLKFSQALNINGIVTFASDIATSTVAFVAAHMGLPACSIKVAETMSNKACFRTFQAQHKRPCPQFFISDSISALEQQSPHLIPPLIFKPIDTSGSRGITKVEDHQLNAYRKAFTYAQNFSRAQKVSVEAYIEGIDVSGDGFLIDGQLYAMVTQKYKRGFMPTGHSLPSKLAPKDQQRIYAEVTKTCQALGYNNGPIDFDVKISDERIIIIEMGPRLGGNGIPELIRRSSGIDLIEMTLQYALNIPISAPASINAGIPCGSWIFGSETAGLIEHLAAQQEIRTQVPELFECRFNYHMGDHIPAFEHSGNSLGYALFDCPAESDYQNIVTRLRSAMQLRIATEK